MQVFFEANKQTNKQTNKRQPYEPNAETSGEPSTVDRLEKYRVMSTILNN
jgi:hypothetical protein